MLGHSFRSRSPYSCLCLLLLAQTGALHGAELSSSEIQPRTGVVTSPNHPGRYPNNFEKTETIQVEQGKVVSLEFMAFDIEYHRSCYWDRLTITDGDGTTLMEKSCGSSLPPDIRSRSNIVKLSFRTDGSVTKSGWSVRWSAVTPGKDELFEGDMKLTEDQLLALKWGSLETQGDLGRVSASEPLRHHRNTIIGNNYLWPSNTVKFELASELSGAEKTKVRTTLQKLQEKLKSCIRFVESSYGVRIFVKNSGGGCWSAVGHQGNTFQELSLSGGCMHTGIIEHEFLHAIGLYHTQSRSDRDNYVEIIWANIPNEKQHNFEKYSSAVVNHFNLRYDFESVMHYKRTEWGINGRTTIQTLDPTKQNVIGQRIGVSDGDIELVKKMYSCDGNTGIEDCCDSVFVSGTWLSGRYTKMAQKHNSRTVYQHYGGRYCIFFGGHWKIESCDWMANGDNSQGFAFSKVLGAVCPDRIGPLWRYFKYGVGGFSGFDGPTSQGPIDTRIQVTCSAECCDKINVSAKWTWLSGRYTKMTKRHNGKAVYQHSRGRYCVFFGGHWKIESCDWMGKGDNSQGLAFTKVLGAVCPGRIGSKWRYFKWGVGGFSGFDGPTSQGPIDTGIQVTCY